MARRVMIMGAAGRDFHNFNVVYRDDPMRRGGRVHRRPRSPASTGAATRPSWPGRCYPDGIPIVPEAELERADPRASAVDKVVFAYSDVSHEHVMHAASRSLAAGADFVLLGPDAHDARASSAGHRRLRRAHRRRQEPDHAPRRGDRWREMGLRRRRGPPPDALRRPRQAARPALRHRSRTSTLRDATIEEREEYEPHIAAGRVVYAGVDYEAILRGGRGGGRRHRLGRRQQRPAVLPARPADRGGRSAAGRATSCATTPARRTCAAPTWWSSTRSTRPRRMRSQALRRTIASVNPRCHRARGPQRAAARAAARSSGRAGRGGRGRPDPHPRRDAATAPGIVAARRCGGGAGGPAAVRRRLARAACSSATRTLEPLVPAMGYGPRQTRRAGGRRSNATPATWSCRRRRST